MSPDTECQYLINGCQKRTGIVGEAVAQKSWKSKVRQPTGLLLQEDSAGKPKRSMHVRNTFIDSGLSRSSSFEDFFQERDVFSCPSHHTGRLKGLFRDLDTGDEGSSSQGPTSTWTPSRGTPSDGTLSRSSSPCRNDNIDDVEDSTAPPWLGLASPFGTPLDRNSFSVASSLETHLRVLEEFERSQRQAPLDVQAGNQPPALTVHQLAPAMSQVLPQLAEPYVARRTVLHLENAIDGTEGVAHFAHPPGNAPCSQSNGDHQILYSSVMVSKSQPPPPCYHEVLNHAVQEQPPRHFPRVDAHTQPTCHVDYSVYRDAEHELVPCRLRNDTCTFLAAHHIEIHPSGFQPIAPHHISSRIVAGDAARPPASCGVALVAHGSELPRSGVGVPTSAPPPGPALGSPELPSVGSAGHAASRCKPCAFIYNKGCENGIMCTFCHLCEPGEKKRRHKEKLAYRRQYK